MFTINKILTFPRTNPRCRLSPCTVYYIEDHYDEAVNGFIIDNYQDIVSAFASKGYGFVYFPLLFHNFSALDDWCSPDTGRAWYYILGNDYAELMPRAGFVMPAGGGNGGALVCRYQNATYAETVPELVERITAGNPLPATSCSRPAYRAGVLYGDILRTFSDDSDSSDDDEALYRLYDLLCHRGFWNYFYDSYTRKQKEQVDKMLQEMEKLGIGRQLLIQILAEGQKKEFVRMRITSSYRIILENLKYCDREVDLPPLHRAIYLLYLSHKEGISIKELVDFQGEVFEIYKKISNGLNTDVQRERVMKATDPFDNRINTIFSFIRRTFENLFESPSVANYYGITGTRGQKRKIELDRKYVIWEKKL